MVLRRISRESTDITFRVLITVLVGTREPRSKVQGNPGLGLVGRLT